MRRAGITKYMTVESCGEKNHDAAAEAAPSPEDTRKYTVLEYVLTHTNHRFLIQDMFCKNVIPYVGLMLDQRHKYIKST